MNPVAFPEANTVIAEDQPEYIPLPAHVDTTNPAGRVTFCWQLNEDEIAEVRRTGQIWHTVLTFGGPLQPQMLTVEKPELVE